jgi:hypothetical protein
LTQLTAQRIVYTLSPYSTTHDAAVRWGERDRVGVNKLRYAYLRQSEAEMKDYIPLIDTAVWAALILAIFLFFGPEIKQRMREGGAVK